MGGCASGVCSVAAMLSAKITIVYAHVDKYRVGWREPVAKGQLNRCVGRVTRSCPAPSATSFVQRR